MDCDLMKLKLPFNTLVVLLLLVASNPITSMQYTTPPAEITVSDSVAPPLNPQPHQPQIPSSQLDNHLILNGSSLANGLIYYVIGGLNSAKMLIENTDSGVKYELHLGSMRFGEVKLLNQTSVIILLSNASICLWNYIDDIVKILPFQSHHDIIYNPKTNSYLTLETEFVMKGFKQYAYDTIIEYSPEGEILWMFNLSQVVSPNLWNGDYIYGQYEDITHVNSLDWNQTSGKIWVNLRNTDQIYQLDYSSRSVDWVLGQNGDFILYDQQGAMVKSLFHQPHDLRHHNQSTITLFDNQYRDPDSGKLHSRLLVIKLNTDQKMARISYQWIAPREFYSSIWGGLNTLPNGNLLGTFGFSNHPAIIEVNPRTGQYWVYDLPNNVYKVTFRSIKPHLAVPTSSHLLTHQPGSITFSAWSSADWSYDKNATVDLLLNGTLISQLQVTLRWHWQRSHIQVPLPELARGNYNLTIILSESGFGKISAETLVLTRDYFLTVPNTISIEDGLPIPLDFKGQFNYDVNLTLEVGNYTILFKQWQGNMILLNDSILLPGSYQLGFQLRNATDLLDQEVIPTTVYPAQAPQFLIQHTPLEFHWGDPIRVDLVVNETSSYSVDVTAAGVTWRHQQIINSSSTITFVLPTLYEGRHQFDVKLTDTLGLQNHSKLIISIIPPVKPIVVSENLAKLDWGKVDNLVWEIHGGSHFRLYRNDSLMTEGQVSSTQLKLPIYWRADNWQLNTYHIRLEVANSNTTVDFEEYLKIKVRKANPYASSILSDETSWTSKPVFSLGPRDGNTAEVSYGYENGALALDMAATVLNQNGSDLTVFATGGTYRVFAKSGLGETYVELGRGRGVSEFDLGSLSSCRYIKITYLTGVPIEVDAIQAKQIQSDRSSDQLDLDLRDRTVFGTQGSVLLSWNITYDLGINYQVEINDHKLVDHIWQGTPIHVLINLTRGTDSYQVKLLVTDILGQQFSGSVVISISRNIVPVVIGIVSVLAVLVVFRKRIIWLIKR